MTTARDVRRIYRYNRAVMEAYGRKLARLPWAVVSKDRGVTWHSMAGVFHHIVGVYNGWLCYVVQGKDVVGETASLPWDRLTNMEDILAYQDRVWKGVDRLLRGLTDASLRRTVKAPWQPKACTIVDALVLVTWETSHHLGEIIAMLWQEDIRPPAMTWLDVEWGLEAHAKRTRPRETTHPKRHRNA